MIVQDELMHRNIAKKYKLVIAVEQLILIKYKVGITTLQTYVWLFFNLNEGIIYSDIYIFMHSVHFIICWALGGNNFLFVNLECNGSPSIYVIVVQHTRRSSDHTAGNFCISLLQ